jgi:hypothetical protein
MPDAVAEAFCVQFEKLDEAVIAELHKVHPGALPISFDWVLNDAAAQWNGHKGSVVVWWCPSPEPTPSQSPRAKISEQALSTISKQMRERASFADTSASLSRLLQTWADVLDGRPDIGWAARNRNDLAVDAERGKR